jgi:hypothetical protein
MTCELECPEYLQRTRNGAIRRIFCKVCSYIIAEQRGRIFWRSRIYAEMKLKFEDGTMHVTSLCQGCLPKVRRDPEALMAIYNADIDDMAKEDPRAEMFRDKAKPRVVAVDTKMRGIP